MALTPTIKAKAAYFRGPSSSSDYNDTNRQAYNDLVNAYAALQKQAADTTLTNEILAVQNEAALTALAGLSDRLQALQAQYSALKTLGSSANGTGTVTLVQGLHDAPVSYGGFPSYYPVAAPMPATNRAFYDPKYGQLLPSLAGAPLSKAYISDLVTGELVYPPGVISAAVTTVVPAVTPYAVEENDLTNAVDGDATSYWRRNVYFPASQAINDVETTVTLTLPAQYVNNLLCNYVTIHPYPEFGIDITSVVLHGPPGTSDRQLLAVDAAGTITPLAGTGKVRLLFPDQQVVSLDVTLRQARPNLNLRPGLQAFSLGAAVLDFGYLAFNQASSLALVPFTLSNNFFQTVTGVGPNVSGVTYRPYYLDPSGDLVRFNFGESLPSFVQTVYIEVSLTPSQGLLAKLESLQIDCIPVYLLN